MSWRFPARRTRVAVRTISEEGLGTDLEPGGCGPYIPGTQLSRIHWRSLARRGELVQRDLSPAPFEAAPLVVVDTHGDVDRDAVDWAARTAAGAVTRFAHARGCRVLLPGDRAPVHISSDLRGWPDVLRRLVAPRARRTPEPSAGYPWFVRHLDPAHDHLQPPTRPARSSRLSRRTAHEPEARADTAGGGWSLAARIRRPRPARVVAWIPIVGSGVALRFALLAALVSVAATSTQPACRHLHHGHVRPARVAADRPLPDARRTLALGGSRRRARRRLEGSLPGVLQRRGPHRLASGCGRGALSSSSGSSPPPRRVDLVRRALAPWGSSACLHRSRSPSSPGGRTISHGCGGRRGAAGVGLVSAAARRPRAGRRHRSRAARRGSDGRRRHRPAGLVLPAASGPGATAVRSFDPGHSYGPLTGTRDGTTLLRVDPGARVLACARALSLRRQRLGLPPCDLEPECPSPAPTVRRSRWRCGRCAVAASSVPVTSCTSTSWARFRCAGRRSLRRRVTSRARSDYRVEADVIRASPVELSAAPPPADLAPRSHTTIQLAGLLVEILAVRLADPAIDRSQARTIPLSANALPLPPALTRGHPARRRRSACRLPRAAGSATTPRSKTATGRSRTSSSTRRSGYCQHFSRSRRLAPPPLRRSRTVVISFAPGRYDSDLDSGRSATSMRIPGRGLLRGARLDPGGPHPQRRTRHRSTSRRAAPRRDRGPSELTLSPPRSAPRPPGALHLGAIHSGATDTATPPRGRSRSYGPRGPHVPTPARHHVLGARRLAGAALRSRDRPPRPGSRAAHLLLVRSPSLPCDFDACATHCATIARSHAVRGWPPTPSGSYTITGPRADHLSSLLPPLTLYLSYNQQ